MRTSSGHGIRQPHELDEAVRLKTTPRHNTRERLWNRRTMASLLIVAEDQRGSGPVPALRSSSTRYLLEAALHGQAMDQPGPGSVCSGESFPGRAAESGKKTGANAGKRLREGAVATELPCWLLLYVKSGEEANLATSSDLTPFPVQPSPPSRVGKGAGGLGLPDVPPLPPFPKRPTPPAPLPKREGGDRGG